MQPLKLFTSLEVPFPIATHRLSVEMGILITPLHQYININDKQYHISYCIL